MNIRQHLRILACGFFVLGFNHVLFAQNNSNINSTSFTGPNGIAELEEKVYFEVLPKRPRVGDTVDISIEMYGTPIKDASFTWYINGTQFEKGIGKHKISFLLEKKSAVRVLILTGEGNLVEKNWNFNPQNTVLLWETNTYTPPFYKGKSLYTPESGLILHAINLDAKNPLTNIYADYTWKVDGTVVGEESGVGKSTYIYQGDLLMQEPLFQVIRSGISAFTSKGRDVGVDSQIESSASIRVQTFPTDIVAYEATPLLGILYNKQLSSSFLFNKNETAIVSYPMYYSLSSSLNGLYTWSINDQLIRTNTNSIAFKKTRDNEQSRLSITIQNPKALLQSQDISYIIDTSNPVDN